MGHKVIWTDEAIADLRQFIVRPYRLIYEIDDVSLAVKVRVLWHGARRDPKIR